jgi:hypothetical protein
LVCVCGCVCVPVCGCVAEVGKRHLAVPPVCASGRAHD